MCYWVATEVCTQPELKKRVCVVEMWIKIAKICFKLKNFNSCMAIISGLNLVAVSRLKNTWEDIDPKKLNYLTEIEAYFSPVSNHRAYRTALSKFMEAEIPTEPIIPIISIFLKDLMFINDGNGKYIPSDSVNINFEKLRTIYCSVMQMVKIQKSSYKETLMEVPNETYEYCLRMHALKEDALYKYSCLCEAKSGDSEKLRLREKWMQESK
jgi:hypothetical protein